MTGRVGPLAESGCEIISQGANNDGDVSWNRDSIPGTQTMSLLEGRILEQGRYQDLQQVIAVTTSTDSTWHPDAVVGYRLSVTEDNEIVNLLPGDLGDGKVTMTASRDWESGSRDHSGHGRGDRGDGDLVPHRPPL